MTAGSFGGCCLMCYVCFIPFELPLVTGREHSSQAHPPSGMQMKCCSKKWCRWDSVCTTYIELNAASRKISHNNISLQNMYIDDDDFCRNEDLHMKCLKIGKLEVPPWPKASLVAQMVKNLPAMQSPGFKSWVGKILWRREWQPPLVLQSIGSQRVRHDWGATTFTFHLDLYTFTRPRRPGSTSEFLDSWSFAVECDGPAPIPSLPLLVLPRNQRGFSPCVTP